MKKILLIFLVTYTLAAKADSTSYRIISVNPIPAIFVRAAAIEVAYEKSEKKLLTGLELGFIAKNYGDDFPYENKILGGSAKLLIGIKLQRKKPSDILEEFFHLSTGITYSIFNEQRIHTFKGAYYGDMEYTYPKQFRQVISMPFRFGYHSLIGKRWSVNPGIETSAIFGSIDKDLRFPSGYIPGAGVHFNRNPKNVASIGTMTLRVFVKVGYRFK